MSLNIHYQGLPLNVSKSRTSVYPSVSSAQWPPRPRPPVRPRQRYILYSKWCTYINQIKKRSSPPRAKWMRRRIWRKQQIRSPARRRRYNCATCRRWRQSRPRRTQQSYSPFQWIWTRSRARRINHICAFSMFSNYKMNKTKHMIHSDVC